MVFERRKSQLDIPKLEIWAVAAYNDNLPVAKISQSLDGIFESLAKGRSLLVVNVETHSGGRAKSRGGEDMHVKSGGCPAQKVVALE
jgi:hypothetical protein